MKLEMTGIRDWTKALSARLPGSFPITWGPEDCSIMEKLKVREVNIPIHGRTATADLGLELRPLSPGAINLYFLGTGAETWNW